MSKPVNGLQFSLRPIFTGRITPLVQSPLQLFLTVWSGEFFYTLLGLQGRAPFIIFGPLAFFGIPAVAYLGKKLNYVRAEYKFYNDRLDFEEGFLTINRKGINFRDVKEVTLRKGILQRIDGLGNVYLTTLATGSSPYANPFSALGLQLVDSCEPQ
jgi:membrane protein YdbS with pleckstrin-like domain